MSAIRLKISDLAIVTGYTRFQLRGLLDEVFPKSSLGEKVGAQRTFSPRDLLVVAVICEIERKYGVKRSMLCSVGDVVRRVLGGPRVVNREARLLVTFAPPRTTYLTPDAPVGDGLIVALGPLFAVVDEYLGAGGPRGEATQSMLPLPPAIATRRGGAVRSR
jgi:hypothetical protein